MIKTFDSYYAAMQSARKSATDDPPDRWLVYANGNRTRFFTVAEFHSDDRRILETNGCNLTVYYWVQNGRLLGHRIGS